VEEVKQAVKNVLVADQQVPTYPGLVLPLHFYICDAEGGTLAIEYVDGVCQVHENPLGVLTNAPPLKWQLANLSNYSHLSCFNPPPIHWEGWTIDNCGQGSGLLGLPGDPTPPSRFVRVAFFSHLATSPKTALETVRLGFHILNTFDIFPGMIQKRNLSSGEIRPSDTTQWVLIHDRTNLRTYFRSAESMQVQMVDLKRIDFAKKGFQAISLKKEFSVEDVTTQAQNVTLPAE
jgi:choloylglycine hydrolase